MRPVYVEAVGAVPTPVVPIDQYLGPTNIGLNVSVVSGAIAGDVQYTFDDIFAEDFNPATAEWIAHSVLNGLSAGATGNLAFPPRAVRFNNTGAGTARLAVIQSGAVG